MLSTLIFLLIVFGVAYVWVKKKEAKMNGEEWSFFALASEKFKTFVKHMKDTFFQ